MRPGDVIVTCGLGFGDEGKGTVVDALARRLGPSDVIRYNGGPQAGHNVIAPDGRWHCFAQLGAASLFGAHGTILGPHMLVELENLETELAALVRTGVPAPERLSIDPHCRLITPMQKFVGRMREIARGAARHGSCGQGVGETVRDAEEGIALHVGDLRLDGSGGRGGLEKLARLSERKRREARELLKAAPSAAMEEAYGQLLRRSDAVTLHRSYGRILGPDDRLIRAASTSLFEALTARRTVLFEGAQGALLDRTRGFRPHVTQSDTSCAHALRLLDATGAPWRRHKLGILRAYGHRHGAGPFVTEDASLRPRFDDARNRDGPWQGPFRVGWLDLPAIRYGIALNGGVDGLALTGLDRLSGLGTIRICRSYQDAQGRIWPRFDEKLASEAGWIGGCRPHGWAELPGWRKDLSGVRRFADLPKNAQAFVRFLESAEGLGTRCEIVSVGPRADQKLFLQD